MANCRIKATLLVATGILLAQTCRDFVLHVEVNLVQVDAEVTDGTGKPVTDLTAADFEILQYGKPQIITNLSFIDTTAGAGVAALGPRVKGAPPLPAVDLQPADVRRTFVMMVDDLGVAWQNFPTVKHALRRDRNTPQYALARTDFGCSRHTPYHPCRIPIEVGNHEVAAVQFA